MKKHILYIPYEQYFDGGGRDSIIQMIESTVDVFDSTLLLNSPDEKGWVRLSNSIKVHQVNEVMKIINVRNYIKSIRNIHAEKPIDIIHLNVGALAYKLSTFMRFLKQEESLKNIKVLCTTHTDAVYTRQYSLRGVNPADYYSELVDLGMLFNVVTEGNKNMLIKMLEKGKLENLEKMATCKHPYTPICDNIEFKTSRNGRAVYVGRVVGLCKNMDKLVDYCKKANIPLDIYGDVPNYDKYGARFFEHIKDSCVEYKGLEMDKNILLEKVSHYSVNIMASDMELDSIAMTDCLALGIPAIGFNDAVGPVGLISSTGYDLIIDRRGFDKYNMHEELKKKFDIALALDNSDRFNLMRNSKNLFNDKIFRENLIKFYDVI